MSRPAVLIVEPDAERRRALGRGLAEEGYEVVPTATVEEGERFARALEPAVIVAPAGLARSSTLDGLAAPPESRADGGMERTLVLLGETPAEERKLPGAAVFLASAGLSAAELVRRLRLVLIGREIGVDADARLESLVGDLALKPLLELVRALRRALATVRIQLGGGAIHIERGEVVAAEVGPVRGLKAFCRLARLTEEPFRVYLEKPQVAREILEESSALVITAIKDSLGEFPDPRTRLKVEMGDDFLTMPLSELQQGILMLAQGGASVQNVLDALPDTDGAIVRELLQLESRGLLRREEVAPPVQVVTDSTADLPAALAREHGIAVVPLKVLFGETAFRDRVDLQPADFYRMLEAKPAHPESSPPAPDELAEIYRRHLADRDVVSVHISSKLSLTAEHARLAAAAELRELELPEKGRSPRLEILDGRQTSLGLGFLALFAARMASRGEAAQAIVERLADMRGRIVLLFVVDTLEYLARGGRIGKAGAFLGGLLGIKPILSLEDGEIEPLDRVRGRRAAYSRLMALVRSRVDPERPSIVGITHARAPAAAERLREMVVGELAIGELVTGETGPVIGTHVGPGAVALTVFQPTDEEAPLIAPLAPAAG